MTDWRKLTARVDRAVNKRFGERVRVIPMLGGGYAKTQDPSRRPVDVVGVYVTLNDLAMNLAGDHSGAPFNQRIALGNKALHVRTEAILPAKPNAGDIVEMLDRGGERYEINRVVHEADGVSMFSLIRADQ